MADRTRFSDSLEKKLAQIQSGEPSPQTAKKRNFSRIVLLVNLVLLVGVFFFAENLKRRPNSNNFRSVSVAGIGYNFSSVQSAKGYIFSLELSADKPRELTFPPQSISVRVCSDEGDCESGYFNTRGETIQIDKDAPQTVYMSLNFSSKKRRPVGLTYYLTKRIQYTAKLTIATEPEIELDLPL